MVIATSVTNNANPAMERPAVAQLHSIRKKKHHPNVKFAAEVSETETKFLDTSEYEGERFKAESVLDVHTH